ncbi:MAG: hypothetical protein LBB31_01275 [Prevotellaceae bacterium]|jgi:hypothetical protein|nr:hypothetical protein [Prevotellaceae bacterium]
MDEKVSIPVDFGINAAGLNKAAFNHQKTPAAFEELSGFLYLCSQILKIPGRKYDNHYLSRRQHAPV